MANINDTNNTRGKLKRQWELLYEADIDERDREAIEEFVRFERKGNQNRAANTLISDLGNLRRSAENGETPLVEMDMASYRAYLGYLTRPKNQGGRGLDASGSGVFGYKRSLRVFFEWLDEQPDYSDFRFVDNIDLPSQRAEPVREEQTFDEGDIETLKSAARNVRDRTLIQFLADTGARISLASQLRIGDIHDLDTDRPYYNPNPDGEGHKGAPSKRYPILYSRADLRSYINNHHVDRRDEAPLWHVLRGYDHDNPESGALSGDRIRDMLRECADRAGIDKSANPHNFRHTAITRLSRAGFSRTEIQHVAGWADDRMLDRYDHTKDKERNDQIRARAGLIDEEKDTTETMTPKTCSNCRASLAPQARFCPNCGTSSTEDGQTRIDQQDDRIMQSAAIADGELAEAVIELRELLQENPRIRAETLDE